MKKYLRTILFLLIIFPVSCKETYYPAIDGVSKVLVVEGLISNSPDSYTILLSNAIRFDTMAYIPVTGSSVFVSDETGGKFYFEEKTPGHYKSDPQIFIPKVGSKYTLNIITKENRIYQSTQQELLPPVQLDTITNYSKTIKFYITSGGILQYLNVQGMELYTRLDFPEESHPFFRFSNAVVAEYFSHELRGTIFCWKKQNLTDYYNLNKVQYNTTGQFEQDLGFCPIDTFFYSIRHVPPANLNQDLYKYIISFKLYHLNEEVHKFYESMNSQLESSQRIFDPISFQIQGNIKCVSDPEEKVFGFFEASSSSLLTYEIDANIFPGATSYDLIKVKPIDFDSISHLGRDSLYPQTWIK